MIKIIADPGSNHNQSTDRALELVRAAHSIGCDAIKFQMFDDRLTHAPEAKIHLKDTKLTRDMVSWVYHECKKLGIAFHCTPFNPDFVDFLDPYVTEFKVGSYEILWLDLIRACAKTRKPLGISTGGATLNEIAAAYTAAREFLPAEFITMYHCDPHYPAKVENAALGRMGMIRETIFCFGDPSPRLGYSDHTHAPAPVLAAVALGVKEIEFHMDLPDMAGSESKHGHVWAPGEAKMLVSAIRQVHEAITATGASCLDPNQRNARTDPRDGMRPMQEHR